MKVEYPWTPPICSNYKVFGHGNDKCGKTVLIKEEKNQNVDKKNENRVNEASVESKSED